MREIKEIIANHRLTKVTDIEKLADWEGVFSAVLAHPGIIQGAIWIIFSWGHGWEQASVSRRKIYPSWEEMCIVKDIFWSDDECVVQYHPPKLDYVDPYPHNLSLWKKTGVEFETPPSFFTWVKIDVDYRRRMPTCTARSRLKRTLCDGYVSASPVDGRKAECLWRTQSGRCRREDDGAEEFGGVADAN
jgi:hypothetical protein